MSEDKPIKAILLGEQHVGKTNLFNKVLETEFKEEYNPTVASNYCQRAICVDNKDYLFNLWDTTGDERFRSLIKAFVKDSQIIFNCLWNW